jgi:S1-C subfamily serine protease/regulation of enolase protein 1 (concanavalin A-like superfamily)
MRPLPFITALAFVSTAARAQEAMPVKTVATIKDATTFIRTDIDSDIDGPVMSGTGFVIRTEGTTAYIVTNAHVITPPRGEKIFTTQPTTKVVFRSGTKTETKAVAEIVATAPERDLALLKVTNVANLPTPIEISSDVEPFETMTVYIFGFPFGQKLATGNGNPPVNVGRGQVSSIRRNEDERVTSVLLDGALNPGNSGGPVVDARGKLVGIARATIRGANIGFAIAAPELVEMLAGRIEEASLTAGPSKNGVDGITFDVPLLDPLNRVKSARLLFTRGAAKFSRTKRQRPARGVVDDEGNDDGKAAIDTRDRESPFLFGPIEGAESLVLGIDKLHASGTIPIAPIGKDVMLWYQVALVDSAGKTVHSKPGCCLLAASLPTDDAAKRSPRMTYWGELIDPDGDCDLKLDNGALACEVPGTLHDLNIDIDKVNGPRVVQGVEGDFVAEVKVSGSFQPCGIPTGPKSVPFNGGGLLVWLDQGNYIRLERASMYRSGRVMGFLNFESREGGTKAQAHNKGGLDPKQDLWLRIKRHGNEISGSLSPDGKTWEDLKPMDIDWPARLKVGVDVINSSGDPMTVQFHNFVLRSSRDQPPAAGLGR